MNTTTTRLPLTKAQRAAINAITKTESAKLRNHIKPSGTPVYRLLDGSNRPVKNFRKAVLAGWLVSGIWKLKRVVLFGLFQRMRRVGSLSFFCPTC